MDCIPNYFTIDCHWQRWRLTVTLISYLLGHAGHPVWASPAHVCPQGSVQLDLSSRHPAMPRSLRWSRIPSVLVTLQYIVKLLKFALIGVVDCSQFNLFTTFLVKTYSALQECLSPVHAKIKNCGKKEYKICWKVSYSVHIKCILKCEGFISGAGLGHLRNDNDGNSTYEGDNNVLQQQASNWLMRLWKQRGSVAPLLPLHSADFLYRARPNKMVARSDHDLCKPPGM